MPTALARMSTRSKIIAASAVVVVAGAVALSVTTSRGEAATTPTAGTVLSQEQVRELAAAAKSCSALTAAKLAGQVMATSGFTAGTGSPSAGIANFTDSLWQVWAPWPKAERTDSRASMHALAHYMCDLIGKVRTAGVAGDQWRLGLAAFHSGVPTVTAAGRVPDIARDYVDRTANFAAWYALQPLFGGPGDAPTPTSMPSQAVAPSAADAIAVPSALVPYVRAAGAICAAVTPARIAGQLMALSRFNENLVSSSGARGIAQFRPEVWARYAPSSTASPNDPKLAIPALGRAMCDLSTQLPSVGGDPYLLALAAYQWGADLITRSGGVPGATSVQAFILQVLVYADHYSRDSRLTNKPTPTTTSSSGGASPTTKPATPTTKPAPTTGTTAQTGRLLNPASGRCLTTSGTNSGSKLYVGTCGTAQIQQWTLMPDNTIRVLGLCMDSQGGSILNGTPVIVATCNGSLSQSFRLHRTEYWNNIVSPVSEKCVRIDGDGSTNGQGIVLTTCFKLSEQTWQLKP